MAKPKLLLLTPPPAEYAGPCVVASLATFGTRIIEAAGRPFEAFLKAREAALSDDSDNEDDNDEDNSPSTQQSKQKSKRKKDDSGAAGNRRDNKRKDKIKTKKLTEEESNQDHYEILGLSDLMYAATDEQIKAAYRRLVVETHPDKTGGGDDTRFKSVQRAYSVLSDPEKRASYDSTIPFDDDISPSTVAPENFYSVFGPVFARNSRWSVASFVPMLGDDSTPYAEVERFYDFWFKFKSWRDFSFADVHNVEDADCRDEKRWMERENERERKKHRKIEAARIQNLVDRAFKNDPRVRRKKDEDRLAREREAEEKRREKALREREERLRVEQEQEQLRKAEEDKKAAEKRQRDEYRKLRELLRKYVQPFTSSTHSSELCPARITKSDLDYYIGKNSFEGLRLAKEEMDKIAAENGCTPPPLTLECAERVVGMINNSILQTEKSDGVDRFGSFLTQVDPQAKKKDGCESYQSSKDVWTEQELTDLTKATAKYPGGTVNRWEAIATYVGSKSAEQVLRKLKELTGQLNLGVAPTRPCELKQGNLKAKGEGVQLTAEERDDPTASSSSSSGSTYPPPPGGYSAPSSASSASAATSAASSSASEDIWTKDQQRQLEEALKVLKDYKEKDKWDKIAAAVAGKSKKQCVERYKFLASMFTKKK